MSNEDRPNVQPGTLFGTGRSSGLRSRLPRASEQPATPAAPTDKDVDADAASSISPSRQSPAPASKPPTPAPAAASPGVAPRPRVVHISTSLAEALRAEAAKDRSKSFAHIVFAAIEATHGQLTFPGTTSGGLFEPQTTARVRPHLRREQVTLRLTPHNESVLDGIAAELGVSRSDLVETALAQHLNHPLIQDQ